MFLYYSVFTEEYIYLVICLYAKRKHISQVSFAFPSKLQYNSQESKLLYKYSLYVGA